VFLLVPAYPRTPGPKAVKRLSVCVAVYSHSLRIRDQEIYNSNQIRNFQLTFKLRDQLTSLEETKEAEHIITMHADANFYYCAVEMQ